MAMAEGFSVAFLLLLVALFATGFQPCIRSRPECTTKARPSFCTIGRTWASTDDFNGNPRDESAKIARTQDDKYAWIWEDGPDTDHPGGIWSEGTDDSKRSVEAILETRRWCEDFVAALELCPWAKASLHTKGAMRFFVVDEDKQRRFSSNRKAEIVHSVARRFQREILMRDVGKEVSSSATLLERAAIYFVIFLSCKDFSFHDFNEWFMDLEDEWPEDLDEDVIIAPFHPQWEFSGTDDDAGMLSCLDYEKRSPHPTVTLVSTRVVENAGEEVTDSIGENNEEILISIERKHQSEASHKGLSIAELWRAAVYGQS